MVRLTRAKTDPKLLEDGAIEATSRDRGGGYIRPRRWGRRETEKGFVQYEYLLLFLVTVLINVEELLQAAAVALW